MRAICDECGGDDVNFDATVDVNGNIVNIFDTAYCETCEDEIKYHYTIVDSTRVET